jgi:ArsR family transcriptional regulator, zinc-responsive transcriptional repressor
MHAEMQDRAPLEEDQAMLAAEVFHMLADPTRVRLLWALIGRERPVNELVAQLGKPGPGVSQHLAKLRLARLVQTRKVGTSVYYRIANDHIEQLVTDAVQNAEHASSDSPVHHRPPLVGDRVEPSAELSTRTGGLTP